MRAPNKRAWDCVETPLSSESKTSRKACVGRWIGDISQCQGMFWHSCQDVPMGKSPNWIWEKLNSKETNYALTHSKRKVQMQVFRFCHASDKKVSERHILLNRKQICKFARQMNSEHFLAHSIWKVLDESQKKHEGKHEHSNTFLARKRVHDLEQIQAYFHPAVIGVSLYYALRIEEK